MSTKIPLHPVEMWRPNNISNTEMEKFRLMVNERFNVNLENYHQLWKWSTDNISDFWATVWNYTNIIHSIPYEQVVESKPMDKLPAWFSGAKLNFAQNLLWCRDENRTAIISAGEGKSIKTISYRDLYDQVKRMVVAMRSAGVRKGDRISAYISNCPEAVIAMLASASIGAIWSSTSTDFGVSGVLDRFSQIRPKFLFSTNSVVYNEKAINILPKLKLVAESLEKEGLEKVIVIPFNEFDNCDLSSISLATSWNDFLNNYSVLDSNTDEIDFEQLPFDHPLYILFSSGTTGKPKCMVHRAGGVLIQHKKEHILHGNMSPNDVFFYYTTTGWMMWNWLVSGLATGCTIVLYEGSPFKPRPSVLWELSDQIGITIFGISAKYIQTLQDVNYKPIEQCNLRSIRIILSTGSPLKPESFDYVYNSIKKDVLLGSITGGTDLCSLFCGLNVTLPVYRGEIQCTCLGMKIEAWDGEDNPVYAKSADLVCTKPFPCMPLYFYNDSHNTKYMEAYFSNYTSIWYHGDYMWINPNTGGVVMLGRSDGTLNPSGVRFGSAEIYNIVENFPEVQDSLAVGQKVGKDERVVLFLKMCDGIKFNDELVTRIKTKIKEQLSPRHVPSFILPIRDIPHTLTGKKVEVAVKRIISGEKVVPSSSLANPESLELYYNLPELKHKL
ncbi:13841_t:CDS:2 [Cetraspora pellucida]|uniref:13841_t:CDS:1 n=1 Tax=Cetraspora pellucida TaxID=1433469 RepID=A0ACA9MIQ9_9GLOM|nr:13841_t:CDS:2 [Cetraspora pellucida]